MQIYYFCLEEVIAEAKNIPLFRLCRRIEQLRCGLKYNSLRATILSYLCDFYFDNSKRIPRRVLVNVALSPYLTS